MVFREVAVGEIARTVGLVIQAVVSLRSVAEVRSISVVIVQSTRPLYRHS